MIVNLVPMTTAHIDALMPYESEMFGTEAWSRRGYEDELRDRDYRYYLAVEAEDGTLLGWGGAYIAAPEAQILTVGTIPEARRQGIAGALIEALVAEAKRRGAEEMFLEVRADNDAAIALYERAGFARLGRRRGYYDQGRMDAEVYRREL